MAQRAARPGDVADDEAITISDEEWAEMLRGADAQVHDLTADEARALFDRESHRVMGLSGEEFLRRYDAGEFRDIPDDAEHTDFWFLLMLTPLGR